MRFRTHIINIPLLHRIIRSLAALARLCVIRLSEDKVHFIVPGNENKDGVQVWSQVKVETLFSNFRVESNNKNEIWLELHLDALLKVLKSADSSINDGITDSRNATSLQDGEVSLKLNKRGNQAIWAFDIRGRSQLSGKPMQITHEINVHVLSPKRQGELNEPLCPPPDIHLVLPNLTDLRNLVSRLGTMADDVKLSANHEGKMELTVRSKNVDLTTTWDKLHIPTQNTDSEEEEEPVPADKMFSAVVPIRAMQKFLTSHLVGGVAIACICEKHCLIAYVYIGEISEAGGVLTFFIPAKTFGDDDD
ncbi:checkpoint protein Hus1/Mec3 [Dioszegia hungarica]|uniref:Checkpoint protein n=1 Tax=Dioszegia hungarica TaxID=4972 RepID=A0AA38H4A0_9TREE|nr:checkpoint protein Hus1/Mec3 [Dioszegia hungarica]KAI9633365.1 checkpoint protein Hus1/Mec3 [Dioszegia hungarica]